MLNEEQKKVVESTEGYVRVSSGAGTGKTTTIVKRFVNILRKHPDVKPSDILCVTFTNKAAEEMSSRIRKELNSKDAQLNVMTFHSLCLDIIESCIQDIGMPATYSINMSDAVSLVLDTIMKYGTEDDLSDMEKATEASGYIARYIQSIERGYRDLEDNEVSEDTDNYVGYMLQSQDDLPVLHSLDEVLECEHRKEERRKEAKKKGEKLEVIKPKDGYVSPTCSWAQRVLNLKRENGILSFDDMLYLAKYILQNIPEIRKQWQSAFKYIMVDEFQDTDFIQFNVIKILAEGCHNLCVVGDVNQSIYSFRNAKPHIFMDFETLLSKDELDRYGYKNLYLTENYRSGAGILSVANDIMRITEYGRQSKDLFAGTENQKDGYSLPEVIYNKTDTEVANEVVREIDKLLSEGYGYNDITFLYRSRGSKMLGVLRETLTLHDIPYVDDLGFTEEEQRMRDAVLSFLFLALNPRNTLLMRKFLLSVTDDETLVNEVMLQYIKKDGGTVDPILGLRNAGHYAGRNLDLVLTDDLAMLWEKYFGLVSLWEYEYMKVEDVGALSRGIFNGTSLGYALSELAEAHVSSLVLEDLDAELRDTLSNLADIHVSSLVTDSIFTVLEDLYNSGASFEEFNDVLSRLSLKGTDTHTMDKNAEAVKFMTMHKSKGLEFPVVFVVDVSNGHFPLKRSKGVLADEEMRLAYVAVTRAENKLYLLSSGDKYTARLSKSPSLPITVLCKADGTVKGGLTFAGDEESFAKAVVEVMESNKIDFDKALNW